MIHRHFPISLKSASAILTLALLAANTWASAREKVLHSFNVNDGDGGNPYANLILDSAGNLYGTTVSGGNGCGAGCGTVFELIPRAPVGWMEKVLYSFKNNGRDGVGPSAGLIFDGAGNLYGTTGGGGIYNNGTIFELTPTANGNWTEKVLHSFKFESSGGGDPGGGLILDSSGNLYGTAGGGVYGDGVVFELAHTAGGRWAEKVLHTFRDDGKDGRNPVAGLIFDAAGNFYGTTPSGGAYYGGGTVFELTPKAGGGWSEKILHSFDNSGHGNGRDGLWPFAGLTLDAQGNLYGTTSSGGNLDYCAGNGCGTVFELSPKEGGHGWTEKILHNFKNDGKDGTGPVGNLIFDAAGKLYSVTPTGGAYNDGTAFELSPSAVGGWTEKILHSFGYRSDGINPSASLVLDFAGNLYGTTWQGGSDEWGTVFEIMP